MNRRSIYYACFQVLMFPVLGAGCSGAGGEGSEGDGVPCQKDTDCKDDRICLGGLCSPAGGTQTQGEGSSEGEPTGGEPTGGGPPAVPPGSPCFELNGQTVCGQSDDPGPAQEEMNLGTVPPPPGPLPSSAGLALDGFTVPNQGSCGSCVAFAVRSGMGLRGVVQTNIFTDFSPAHIWHIAGYGAEHCDSGSSIWGVVADNDQEARYVVPAAAWPYSPSDPETSLEAVPPAEQLAQGGIAHIDDFVGIDEQSALQVKYAIVRNWPPVLGVPVFKNDWQDGDIGVPADDDVKIGYHAITLVSYDDATSSFRFVNSWGTGFGEGGFGTMSYDFVDGYATGGVALRQLTYNEGGIVCGDGICEGDETQSTCCVDCGCPQGFGCEGGECVEGSSCGDGAADPGEACDGSDLDGQSCASVSFEGGQLSCKADCTLNTSDCCNHECSGNDAICLGSTTVQSCGNYDADACFEYGASEECSDGQTCSSGACGCAGGDEGQFDVLDHVYPNFGPLGCSGDDTLKLKAAAKMISPTVLRIYVRKADDSSFGAPETLRLYVGEGPTCPNPVNVEKQTKPLVVNAQEQTFDVTVNPYGASWALGETKEFWVGKDEGGFESFRASGTILVTRNCIP